MSSEAAVLEGVGESTTTTAPVETESTALLPGNESNEAVDYAEPPAPPTEDAKPAEPAGEAAAETTETTEESGEPTESTETAESEAAEVAEGAEAAEPAGYEESLLAQASRSGLDAEQAKAFGSPESLQLALIAMDRQAAAWGKAQILPQQEPTDTGVQAPPPDQTREQQQQQLEAAFEKFKLEGNPEDWDENVYKALSGINDHYHGQFAQTKQQYDQLRDVVVQMHGQYQNITRQSQEAEAAQTAREFDGFFASLGDEYKSIYGTGMGHSLDPNSDAFKNRREFFLEAEGLKYAEQIAGRPPQPRAELLKRVIASRHVDLIKQSTRKEIAAKLQQRNKQSLSRPAGGQTKAKTPEEAALQFLRQNAPRVLT